MSRRKRQFLILATILATVYVSYVSIMASQQNRIIFAGKGMPLTADLRDAHPMATYIDLASSFGTVRACYLESDREFDDGPIAIVAHGNAETIGHWSEIATTLNELGLSVLLVEYPGYGGSEGTPTNTTIRETFASAHAWLNENRGLSRRKLIGLGQGFGSGPMLELSTSHRLDALILIAPYTSLASLTRSMALPSSLLRTNYDNVAALTLFQGPTLILHGDADQLIPPAHSRRLARTNQKVTYQPLAAAHKDLWKDPALMSSPLKAWLTAEDLP